MDFYDIDELKIALFVTQGIKLRKCSRLSSFSVLVVQFVPRAIMVSWYWPTVVLVGQRNIQSCQNGWEAVYHFIKQEAFINHQVAYILSFP